ncbi:hypothetical protein GTY54_19280 [Streptomyces sp. SID625]|nr:hypothetical protein [Streptomyces sp. SID625]
MASSLSPARTAQLFAGITVHQQQFLTRTPPVPLPHCPACQQTPRSITVAVSGAQVRFGRCGHLFTLTRDALLAGLRAQRAA